MRAAGLDPIRSLFQPGWASRTPKVDPVPNVSDFATNRELRICPVALCEARTLSNLSLTVDSASCGLELTLRLAVALISRRDCKALLRCNQTNTFARACHA